MWPKDNIESIRWWCLSWHHPSPCIIVLPYYSTLLYYRITLLYCITVLLYFIVLPYYSTLLYYRITLLYCITVLYYFVFLVRWRVLLYNNPLSYLYPSPLLSEALEFVYLSVAIGFEISTCSVHFLWRFALSKSVPSSVRDNDRKFPHFCRLFRHALLCALINGRQLFVNVLMCSIRCFIPSSCQQLSSLCHAITLVSAH